MKDDQEPKQHGLYRPLTPPCTRVFELEAGEYSDPIVGRLVHQAIDGEPYEAVSYVWGDWTNRRDIHVDGNTLSVTASLHTALAAFRHRPTSPGAGPAGRGPVRRLWADAVCINQEDLRERTSQVELMAKIFAGAQRVLAWLGWEKDQDDRQRTRFAMRFIHSFMDDPEGGLRLARILLLNDGVNPSRRRSLLTEEDQRQYDEQAEKWDTIKSFFEIEYFHRTWIVQELGLAREAMLYTALEPGSRTNAGHDAESEVSPLAVELDFIDWKLVGRFVEYLDYNAASLVTHLGMLLWVPHHILMIWERKEDGSPDCDFLTAMHWARILGVTDPRDRVFSLLGHPLAVLDGEPVVKPDYTITRGVAYTKLAAHFIRQTNNLYVVSLVDHETHPCAEARDWNNTDDGIMPSWVPDWHSINRTTPLPYPVAAAEAEDASISIMGDVDGTEGSPLPQLLVRGWIVDEVEAVSHRMETTDFPLTNLEREREKKNPFWLDRIWALVYPAAAAGEAEEALAVLEGLSLALSLGSREEGEPASRVGGHQSLEEHRRSFAAYVIEYHDLRQVAREPSGGDTAEDGGCGDGGETNGWPAISLYEGLPRAAQAELRRRAKDMTGTRFVECMTWPSMCRVVYRTATGLVGIGSRITLPGDLVCRVRGSAVLMNLRRTKASSASDQVLDSGSETAMVVCTYVGPTVVPQRMKASLIDGARFGERIASFRIL